MSGEIPPSTASPPLAGLPRLLTVLTPRGRRRAALAFLPVLVLIALAYAFVDRPVATWVAEELPMWFRHGALRLGRRVDGHPIIAILLLAALASRAAGRVVLARRLLFVAGAILLAALSVIVLKFLLGRARPELWISDGIFGFGGLEAERFRAAYNGFPSGHSSAFGALARALALTARGPWRWVLAPICLALAASRVFANKHFVGDVIAGLFVGVLAADSLWDRVRRSCSPSS